MTTTEHGFLISTSFYKFSLPKLEVLDRFDRDGNEQLEEDEFVDDEDDEEDFDDDEDGDDDDEEFDEDEEEDSPPPKKRKWNKICWFCVWFAILNILIFENILINLK